jgi:hypothetical protein
LSVRSSGWWVAGAGLALLVALASFGLLRGDQAGGALPSCVENAKSVERATTERTRYEFVRPGQAVDALGVHWMGKLGDALRLRGTARGCWKGGRVDGPYDDRSVYECEPEHCPEAGCPTPCLAYHVTACMGPRSPGGQQIEDFECTRYGDGISRKPESGDLVIRRVHLHDLHDDAIEDDYGLSNTRVFDSLLDGVNGAFGNRQRSSVNNVATGTEWEVRDSLIRVRPNANPYKRRPGHGGFWKGDHDPTHQQRIRLTNNVFVAQGPKRGGLLFPVVGYVDECAGNTLLWAGPLAGPGGWVEALDDQRDFPDGLSDGERLTALNATFPGCFRVVLKPLGQSDADFLRASHAELGGKSWTGLLEEWLARRPRAAAAAQRRRRRLARGRAAEDRSLSPRLQAHPAPIAPSATSRRWSSRPRPLDPRPCKASSCIC